MGLRDVKGPLAYLTVLGVVKLLIVMGGVYV